MFALVIATITVLLAGCQSTPTSSPATVGSLDLQRYTGRWVQIAAIPAWFQRHCVRNITADYSLADDGMIDVVNACATGDGEREVAKGVARAVGPVIAGVVESGKLEVTFVELFGDWWWIAGGDYWVLALDGDYRWSLVGDPDRSYAWLLAREPTLDEGTLRKVAALLAERGYDPCALIVTAGPPEARQRPLCQV
jgi:apolipoprotein D and lipocalin family protein